MAEDFAVVLVTSPTHERSLFIASALVAEKVAACVNILPGVTSVYRWEGEIHKDEEEILVIKTRRDNLPALESRVKEMHPFDVPEIVALPIQGGSAPYLQWLADSTA